MGTRTASEKLRSMAHKLYKRHIRHAKRKSHECAEKNVSAKEKKDTSQRRECNHNICHVQHYNDILTSITKNLRTWCFFMVAMWVLGNQNFPKAMSTFFVMLFLVYYIHYESHNVRNFYTISHHYHHEQNNWLSHGIQILMELQFGLALPIMNELLLGNILDRWVIVFLYLFYSSVHNINYSLYHVNKTHELHHKNIYTNMGPDICDVIFQTKNQEIRDDEDYIEDVSHYNWNIFVSACIVLILKYLYTNPIHRVMMDVMSYTSLFFVTAIILCVNMYLMCTYA